MPYIQRPRRFKFEINAVPYIDVMLILVIIFLITTTSNINSNFINLPSASNSNSLPNKYIEITLLKNTCFSLKTKNTQSNETTYSIVTCNNFTSRLKSLCSILPNVPIIIEADKEIKYQALIELMSQINKLGITRVGLATR